MVKQSQVREGLCEITLHYRSFDSNHARHVCETPVPMRQTRRRVAMLSPAGHTREYSCLLPTRSGNAPEVGHKRMSESVTLDAAEARHAATGCWSILPSRCDGRLRGQRLCVPDKGRVKHEAKWRGMFQSALAGETRCWDRGLGGRERPIFSSCACRRRRREFLAARLFREPRG